MKRWIGLTTVVLAFGCAETGGGSADATQDATPTDSDGPDGTTKPDVPKPLPDIDPVKECAEDTDCDDGLFCNGTETCRPAAIGAASNGCLPGEPPRADDADLSDCVVFGPCDEETDAFPELSLEADDACDDGIACTTGDVCSEEGRCEGAIDHVACDDGRFCNGDEICTRTIGCVAGVAPEGTDPTPGDCLVPGPCDETTDNHPLIPAPLDQPCNDAIDCTTQDGCTSAGTCAGTPNNSTCDDDLFCNGEEVCVAGVGCELGTLTTPDPDLNDCLVPGPCDEDKDVVTFVPGPAEVPCDDGVDCTQGDVCSGAGVCVGAKAHSACSDGLFCNGAELCTAAGCENGLPPTAVDLDPTDCEVPTAVCDEATDGFGSQPAALSADCDDAVECTLNDKCDALGTCAGIADDGECDDGLFCNGEETCSIAGCQDGTPPLAVDTDQGDCLIPLACDELTDSFPFGPRGDGVSCNDGSICTTGETCDGSACEGSAANEGLACNDGSICTTADICTSGTCGGTAGDGGCPSGVCEDNACQDPSCSDNVPNGDETGLDCGGGCEGCPPGSPCLVADDCQSGSCVAGGDDLECL